MQNGRLFELLYLLVQRRSLTAGELASRFEVSTRTIYRDIDALSAAGIPVYTQKGQGGGIRLMDQFVLDRCLLSPREQDEILFSLQSLMSTRAVEGKETLSRLSALFRRDGGDWLEADFSQWGSTPEQQQVFALVKEAILSRRPLSFTYSSSSGQYSRRQVEPAKLRFKGNSWYLQAWCRQRQDWRTFRLSRMEDPVLGEETFPPRPGAPPELEGSEPVPHMVHLRLRFSPGASYLVMDSFPPQQVRRQDGGELLVECDFPEDNWPLGFLLSFGSQVEVLSPARWRDYLVREAKKIAELYETGQTVSGYMGYPVNRTGGDSPSRKQEEHHMERIFCQSCGMPLDAPADHGTDADGSPSRTYCRYCWSNGAFTDPDMTMDDMVALNLKFNRENGQPFGPQEEAEKMMRAWFPTLARWKK